MTELLKKLTDTVAPSGNEEAIASLIRDEISPYVDEIATDALGNLTVHKKGVGKKVLFAAHMDEIGFMVTYIEEEGFLRFAAVGGIDRTDILHKKVAFPNGTVGVIGCPTEDPKAAENPKINTLFIDIGAKNREDAEKKVHIGDVCGFLNAYHETETAVISKSLDDRIGCYILIEAIKQIKRPANDLYFVFTSQEEIGLRGAATSAFSVMPDFAVAVDVTDTGDTPGAEKSSVTLGGGVGIHAKDKRMIVTAPMKERMVKIAEDARIPYQMVICEAGTTDGSAIQLTGAGVSAGVLDIPTRYIHSPSELVEKSDVENAIRYIVTFAETPQQ